jgi:hypothetical protein
MVENGDRRNKMKAEAIQTSLLLTDIFNPLIPIKFEVKLTIKECPFHYLK